MHSSSDPWSISWHAILIMTTFTIIRMPVTPATALLFDQPYVMLQWPILAARLPPPSSPSSKLCSANQGEWEDIWGTLLFHLRTMDIIALSDNYHQYTYITGSPLPRCFLTSLLLRPHVFSGCASIGMTGLCCPTADGSILACCDSLVSGEKRMQEEWRSLIYIDHAGMYHRSNVHCSPIPSSSNSGAFWACWIFTLLTYNFYQFCVLIPLSVWIQVRCSANAWNSYDLFIVPCRYILQ